MFRRYILRNCVYFVLDSNNENRLKHSPRNFRRVLSISQSRFHAREKFKLRSGEKLVKFDGNANLQDALA